MRPKAEWAIDSESIRARGIIANYTAKRYSPASPITIHKTKGKTNNFVTATHNVDIFWA